MNVHAEVLAARREKAALDKKKEAALAELTSLEVGESGVERLFKYQLLGSLYGGHTELSNFDRNVAEKVIPVLQRQKATFNDFKDAKVDTDELSLGRHAAVDLFVRHLAADPAEFVSTIGNEVGSLLRREIKLDDADVRLKEARHSLGVAQTKLWEVQRACTTPEQMETLEHVNELLKCGALGKLVQVQVEYAQDSPRQPIESPQQQQHGARRLVGRVLKHLPFTRESELAKARDWQGTGTNRISTRRARMYNLNTF